ncbi:MAG: DUF1700 domain-containing protein [Clostridia bacterium]|nr:DUF1700 domain-containing protein [Clostridia bacterium]
MNKQEFLEQLQTKLSALPQKEREEQLTFYGEMIDDRMEEGLSEEAAVRAIGEIDTIVDETPLPAATPKKAWRWWEILLLALGSPIWLSLGIAAIAVVLSLYAALWSLVIALWAVFGSLIAGAVGGVTAGIIQLCIGKITAGLALIGGGLVCGGLSIFLFFGCKAAGKGVYLLTKKPFAWIGRKHHE